MKLHEIKLSEMPEDFLTDKEDILDWLSKHDLNSGSMPRYTIKIANGIVDIITQDTVSFDSATILMGKNHLPVQFGDVTGIFKLSDLPIMSLRGCPKYVGHSFMIHRCKNIKSLVGFPAHVYSMSIRECGKLSLIGISESLKHVEGGSIIFADTDIVSGGIGLLLIEGLDVINGVDNPAFDIIRKYLGRPDDIFECQAELIENGFEEYAQL